MTTVTPKTEVCTAIPVTPERREKERELLELQSAYEFVLLHNAGIQQVITDQEADNNHTVIRGTLGGSLLNEESIRKVKDEDLDDVLGKIHEFHALEAKEFARLKAVNNKRYDILRKNHTVTPER